MDHVVVWRERNMIWMWWCLSGFSKVNVHRTVHVLPYYMYMDGCVNKL